MSQIFQEHLSYFQLPRRLDLYSKAIEQCIKPGDTVADLGCGFGVLGVLCLKHGASRVYGIDDSDALHVAREMAQRAGLEERYICIAGSSYKTDLPEKVDLIICDHVGHFGADYGMIAMLNDAQKRFLKPGGIVIPRELRLEVAAVSSTAHASRVELWSGVDSLPEFHWLREKSANTKHVVDFTKDEIVSDAGSLGSITLGDEAAEFFQFSSTLTADQDAEMHGLGGWYSCLLGGDVRMTNSPLEEASIGRSQAFLPLEQPIAVSAGDRLAVSVKMRPDDAMLAWSVENVTTGTPVQKMSTWKGAILDPDALGQGQKK
ncbi:MAG: 50S ribosomal protein L11 methyltransferase [Marinomonas sp.]